MRLTEVIRGVSSEILGADDVEITGISCDSRKVERGAGGGVIFVAVPGEHTDGHAYIKSAVDSGASAVLAERATEGVKVPQVIVKEIRAALSKVSDNFWGRPSERLRVVGITGTNGKTTTTYLLESVIKEAGGVPGVIGTVNYRYGGGVYPAPHTTPQSPDLHRVLREMADSGVTHCIMEVSSHALEQKRVADCRFACGVFTNLTLDHLDYHKTMEEYFRCKTILFRLVEANKGAAVINRDDPWGARLIKEFPSALTYGLNAGGIRPESYALKDGGIEAVLRTPAGSVSLSSDLVGEYNLYNILAAAGAAVSLGVDGGAIARGIAALKRVPGRLEKVEATGKRNFRAYVDYAHTGDALERALGALRAVAAGRIITVFGCGGNRDRSKRPVMGEIAARLSEITIVTSDNPRDEDPLEIINEVEAGIKGIRKLDPNGPFTGKCYAVIPDRAEAIRKAVGTAQDGDTILVAGKGHEDYQIVKGKKHHFDDFEVVKSAIKEHSAKP
jgi:UDP-N-acetylmuramoyl-L-alanyl-D-glutamate--2,6-diaminopimelate ligase